MGWCGSLWALLLCYSIVTGCLGLTLVSKNEALEYSKSSHSMEAMKFVITSQKGDDGRWTEEVKMVHGGEDWHVEVDREKLEGDEGQPMIQLTAIFSSKPKRSETSGSLKIDGSHTRNEPLKEVDMILKLFPKTNVNWFGAKETCEQWGGHLAIPNSKAKMEEMTKTFKAYSEGRDESTSAFLGFTDQRVEGYFETIFGKPVFSSEKSVWSPQWFRDDQPDDDKSWTTDGEDCGSLHSSGGLNDVPCQYNLPFFCEKVRTYDDSVAEERDSEDEAVRKDEELREEKIEDSILELFTHSYSNWMDAKRECIEWGGHLAIPNSEAKMLKMTKMLASLEKNPNQRSAFLGFTDIEEEGNFVTIFGEPVFSPSASWSPHWFNPDQPDDDKDWSPAGEDCGSIHPNGGLNDVPCQYNLPYFCEKPSLETHNQEGVEDIEELEDHDDEEEENYTVQVEEHDQLYWKLFEQDNLDWLGAKRACEEWGGQLAIPNTLQKISSMGAEMLSRNVKQAFLNFGDQNGEGEPVFSTTEPRRSPHSGEDQPNDSQGEFKLAKDCPSISQSGDMNDLDCKHKAPFFCEKRLGNITEQGEGAFPDAEGYSGIFAPTEVASLTRDVDELNSTTEGASGYVISEEDVFQLLQDLDELNSTTEGASGFVISGEGALPDTEGYSGSFAPT